MVQKRSGRKMPIHRLASQHQAPDSKLGI